MRMWNDGGFLSSFQQVPQNRERILYIPIPGNKMHRCLEPSHLPETQWGTFSSLIPQNSAEFDSSTNQWRSVIGTHQREIWPVISLDPIPAGHQMSSSSPKTHVQFENINGNSIFHNISNLSWANMYTLYDTSSPKKIYHPVLVASVKLDQCGCSGATFDDTGYLLRIPLSSYNPEDHDLSILIPINVSKSLVKQYKNQPIVVQFRMVYQIWNQILLAQHGLLFGLMLVYPYFWCMAPCLKNARFSEEPHHHDALGPIGATGHLLGETWPRESGRLLHALRWVCWKKTPRWVFWKKWKNYDLMIFYGKNTGFEWKTNTNIGFIEF